jgi:hypothetical protein
MYRIMGRHKGQVEELDTADTPEEAAYLATEYRMALKGGYTVWYE